MKETKEPTNAREVRIKQLEEKKLIAKNARITNVKAEIEAARVAREKKEQEDGFVETPAVKSERETEEKRKLAEATKDRKIEYIANGTGSAQGDSVIDTLNQVIAHINGDEFVPEVSNFKATDSLYYNETGRTSPDVAGEAAVK